eukprot:6066534-Prymnesium_polylepis.1
MRPARRAEGEASALAARASGAWHPPFLGKVSVEYNKRNLLRGETTAGICEALQMAQDEASVPSGKNTKKRASSAKLEAVAAAMAVAPEGTADAVAEQQQEAGRKIGRALLRRKSQKAMSHPKANLDYRPDNLPDKVIHISSDQIFSLIRRRPDLAGSD